MDASILRELEVAEYEKIRKHVVAQLAKAGSRFMRLASSRDLAKRFGVSRPTVDKALKHLVDDGYLTIKRGIGIFTRPEKFYNPPGAKLLGLLIGDGKATFITRTHWRFSIFAETIQRRDERNLLRNCLLVSPLNNPDELFRELQAFGLDGLLWFFPPNSLLPAVRRLKALGMPVVSVAINERTPGISNFRYDFAANNRHAANLMFAEGRRNPVLVLPTENADELFLADALAGFKSAFEEREMAFKESSVIRLGYEDSAVLAKAIKTLKPDALIFNMNIMPFWKTVDELLDIAEDCRLYAYSTHIHESMGYAGYVGMEDFTSYAEMAADNFEAQQASSKDAPVLDCPMRLEVRLERGGKTIRPIT